MTATQMVPGVAVRPSLPHQVHLTEIPLPPVGATETLIRVLEVGFCGTDREIIEGHIGAPPDGAEAMVIGHEAIGVVEAIGSGVSGFAIGDFVVPTARRGCDCSQCLAGEPDFCSKLGYKERGIFGLHGFLTERFVEDEANLVKIPASLRHLGVLTEPLSVAEKAWRVAQAVQTRMTSWRPKTAIVIGAGPIGVLSTLLLRSHGITVHTLDLKPAPNLSSELLAKAGANYLCSAGLSTAELLGLLPRADVIIECSGSSAPVFTAMELLGSNGVLVSLGVGGNHGQLSVPADTLTREFVLRNKVWVGSVNSSLTDFAMAVRDLHRFEEFWPGLTTTLITRRLKGLNEALSLPDAARGSVKTIIEM